MCWNIKITETDILKSSLANVQYSRYPTSVAALSFSRDGRLLAVASSYTYEEGDKP
jgi:hypothetical protein